MREAEEHGLRIVRSRYALMDLMLACDTVVIGLPSRSHEAVSVLIRNKEFAEALSRRLREYLEAG